MTLMNSSHNYSLKQ